MSDYDFLEEFNDIDWDTELDVSGALKENGYEVSLLGLCNDISILLEELVEFKPNVIFNLAEVFNQKNIKFSQNKGSPLSYLL